jgi:hypothetical protein
MAEPDKKACHDGRASRVVSSLAQTDALAKLLIEKGLIAREEFMEKISKERAAYQKLLKPAPQ